MDRQGPRPRPADSRSMTVGEHRSPTSRSQRRRSGHDPKLAARAQAGPSPLWLTVTGPAQTSGQVRFRTKSTVVYGPGPSATRPRARGAVHRRNASRACTDYLDAEISPRSSVRIASPAFARQSVTSWSKSENGRRLNRMSATPSWNVWSAETPLRDCVGEW